jgi:hypothetical protein
MMYKKAFKVMLEVKETLYKQERIDQECRSYANRFIQ